MFGFAVINIGAAGIQENEFVLSHTVEGCLQRSTRRYAPDTELNAVNGLRVDVRD